MIHEEGYEAGLEGNDNCPYLLFSPSWWTWQAGHAVGHQVHCAQLEAILLHFPQD